MSDTGTTRRELLQASALAAGAAVLASHTLTAQNAPAEGEAWKQIFPAGFQNERVKTSGAEINVVHGGSGPPVLLFHGAPQSLVTWNIIAPDLAKDYSIYMCDLRGYGDSSKPAGEADHSTYSKKAMALDGVEVMQHFGHRQFRMVGHDRGGRVGRRMALDHPDKVLKLAVLDIVPAHYLYTHVTLDFVRAYPHWFNYLLPNAEETLLGQNQGGGRGGAGKGGPGPGPAAAAKGAPAEAAKAAPKGDAKAKGKGAASPIQALVQAEYRRHNANPAMIHAMCEDYRASASIDLKEDLADAAKGKKIKAPLLTLWAATGAMGRMYDVLSIWKQEGTKVSGKGLPGNHSLQESAPAETLAELQAFLKG